MHHPLQDPYAKPPCTPAVYFPPSLKTSEAGSSNVLNVCCETCQSQSTIPPCSTGVIVHASLFIPQPLLRPYLLSFLHHCGELRLSNRGIHHIPLTAGTAGAGMCAECCLFCVCMCVEGVCDRVCTGEHLC